MIFMYCLRLSIVSSSEFERTPSSSFEYQTSTGSLRLPWASSLILSVVETIGLDILFANREAAIIATLKRRILTINKLSSAYIVVFVKSLVLLTITSLALNAFTLE